MMTKGPTLIALALILGLGAPAATGQEYEIETHVIGGGGGTGSAGEVVLTGTIGQPAAGVGGSETIVLHSGFWGSAVDVVVEADESFEDWMENLPDEQKPPENLRGPEDIAVGDGMPNLLKYALGLMPMTPAADAAPAMALEEGDLAVELERSADAAVSLSLEGSTDLDDWENVPVEEEITWDLGDGREGLRLVSGLAADEHPNYFLRLRVVME